MESTHQEVPFVSCICPTFHRPKLLANALACFLAQDYPADRRQLVILDDGNDFDAPDAESYVRTARLQFDEPNANVYLFSRESRFRSLPEKFNDLALRAGGDVLVVWEDDDIYLPHHISSHVESMRITGRHYSKPSTVLSTYTGQVKAEDARGRFHASIAFTRDLFIRLDGWPLTKRADFDQQFMANLQQSSGVVADPCQIAPPPYVFRYGSTHAYHGQHFMRSPDDEGWYDRVPRQPGNRDLVLYPMMDDETRSVYAKCSSEVHSPWKTDRAA